MAKNPYPVLRKNFHNKSVLFRDNDTRNTISCGMVYNVKKPDFFYHGTYSLRSMAIVSLKALARGKPTTGHHLVFYI